MKDKPTTLTLTADEVKELIAVTRRINAGLGAAASASLWLRDSLQEGTATHEMVQSYLTIIQHNSCFVSLCQEWLNRVDGRTGDGV